jgi:hypothetical protein
MHITFEVTVSMKLVMQFCDRNKMNLWVDRLSCLINPLSMLVQLPLEIYNNLVQFYYKLCKSVTLVDQRSKLFEL